jgi:hypothetical protein
LNTINSKFNSFLDELRSNKKSITDRDTLGSLYKRKSSKDDSPLIWSPASLNMITKSYSKSSNADELPDRVFIKRHSLLTEMFKISHVKTIRNIFSSIMLVLAMQVISTDFMEKGVINLNFDLIRWCFGKATVVFYTWLYMMLSTSCLVYFSFHYWANHRIVHFYKTHKSEINSESKSKYLSLSALSKLYLFDTCV